jgi:hypothetical protein
VAEKRCQIFAAKLRQVEILMKKGRMRQVTEEIVKAVTRTQQI